MTNPKAVRLLFIILSFYLALTCKFIHSLKHHLVLTNDHREQVSVSTFGYNRNGRLEVIVQNLTLSPDLSEDSNNPSFGFVMVKSDQARNPYAAKPFQPETYRWKDCLLKDPRNQFNFDLMTLSVLPIAKKVKVQCTGDKVMFPNLKPLSHSSRKESAAMHSAYIHTYNKRAAGVPLDRSTVMTGDELDLPERRKPGDFSPLFHKCPETPESLPLEETMDSSGRRVYSFNFTMFIKDKSEEGTYYLSFHNCNGRRMLGGHYSANPFETITPSVFNLSMLIVETNWPEVYLSAGLQPLPQMYFMLSVMFFLSGCIWLNFIKRQKENVLKIHKLMTVLIFAKACSLLFHGINYHYIALNGQPVVTWAYLYYATRSVKGALFFITLALIGSGWSFIKHILSPREKDLIVVIVALQVIAHIAEIILDESTEGEASIDFFSKLCGLIDLFSCVAILLLISWSLKHLQEASSTDGKAALNLRKMEVFKCFYIISTIYIYVTRIMTYAVLSMLVFKYSWLAELFYELATLIYFIVTGYYFQPVPQNPYLLLAATDNDQDEDILFSVDAQEMNGTQLDDLSDNHHHQQQQYLDKGPLLGEDASDQSSSTTRTRRVAEEFV